MTAHHFAITSAGRDVLLGHALRCQDARYASLRLTYPTAKTDLPSPGLLDFRHG